MNETLPSECPAIAKRMKELYLEALNLRICRTKGEFAKFIGYSQTTLSSAFAGKPSYATNAMVINTESMIEGWKAQHNLTEQQEPEPEQPETQKETTTDDSDVVRVTKIFAEQLTAQRESYERIIMALANGKL